MNRARARILVVALLPGLLGAAGVPYADDPWIEVTTPNFQLISNADEPVTHLGDRHRVD